MKQKITNIRLLSVLLFTLSLAACNNVKKSDNKQFEIIELSQNWKIQTSEKINVGGEKISFPDFDSQTWIPAKVPGTILANLVENGIYKDIFFGKNLENIDTTQFRKNWWYRTEFELTKQDVNHYTLLFEGLNYRANIWLNGKQIAKAENTESPYKMFRYQVNENLISGKNVLAVEIIPPLFNDLTIGFVDWNPTPPDNNMGLWRGVKLLKTGALQLDEVFVKTDVDTKTLKSAHISIETQVTNFENTEKEFTIDGKIGEIIFSKKEKLKPLETKKIEFSSKEFSQLTIENPKLWWINGLGEPNLYNLEIAVSCDDYVSDTKNVRFGIREIEQYVNENGHKGWKINGQKILIKGAGWVDDILLSDTDEKVEAQMDYVKHMNLNTVRLEGFWGSNQKIYDAADERGLLIMIGWSCQWEWQSYCGRPETNFMSITSEHDMKVQTEGYFDQVRWLRNHPSVFLWVFGSDKLLLPKLEKMLQEGLNQLDGSRPTLASCKWWDYGSTLFNTSEVSGKTGVKMLGPYVYVTPNYWYEDTTAGGAYGFNTETGPGPQVPPIESIRKMIPQKDLFDLNGEIWQYHCGRNEFQTLNHYLTAFDARYGKSTSVEDFAQMSQVSNYEAIRPMFEAFAANKFNSTGVIQWMLNSAWPEMYWQLYDWYLMPNGAFYGTKEACKPLNAIYNYKDGAIYITSEFFDAISDLRLEVNVLDINSNVLFSNKLTVNAEPNSSKKVLDIPKLEKLTTTYFVNIKLYDKNSKELTNKMYWLSTKADVFDYQETTWVGTPNKSFADLKALRTLEKAKVSETHEFIEKGDFIEATVKLKNESSKVAFMLELLIVGSDSGESILPVFWSDNYVSLLGGETRVLTAKFRKDKLGKQKPVLKISGINLP